MNKYHTLPTLYAAQKDMQVAANQVARAIYGSAYISDELIMVVELLVDRRTGEVRYTVSHHEKFVVCDAAPAADVHSLLAALPALEAR